MNAALGRSPTPGNGGAPVRLALLLLLLVALRPGVAAQESEATSSRADWLSGDRLFPSVLADPREPKTNAALIFTDLFALSGRSPERPAFRARGADPHGRELQADVSFGGHLPLARFEPWSDGALLVGVEGAIFGRFRLEPTQNDLVGSDWVVALPVEVSRGAGSGRVRLRHWSAHLGDEMAEESGAKRISYGIDVLDVQGAYSLDERARVYGGGSLAVRSTTEILTESGSEPQDGGSRVHVGAEGSWPSFGSDRLSLVTAVDWEAGSITDWQPRTAFLGGFEYRRAGRGLRLVARGFDGPSPVGQFFGSREQFWGVELQALW